MCISVKIYWGYLAVLALLVDIVTSYTPFIVDDWYQGLVFGTDREIDSFRDFIQSRYNHYMEQNGRIFPETVANLFGVIGKEYFNVLNGVMFVAFIHLIIKNWGMDAKARLQNVIVVSFIILLLYPGFTDCFLWMSGSCNYLWSAVAVLFYWNRFKAMNESTVIPCLLLFVLGVLCGVCNEAIVFPFVFGISLYALIHRKELRGVHYYMLVGLFIGTILLISCPALWERVSYVSMQDGELSLGSAAISKIRLSYKHETILLVFLLFLAFFMCTNKHMCMDFVKENTVLLIMLCISCVLILFSKSLYERSNFGTNLLSIILLLRLLSFFVQRTWPKYIVIILVGCSITTPLLAIPYCVKNYQEYEDIEHVITTNNSEIIPTCEVHPMNVLSRFVGRCIPSDNNGLVKTYDASFYVNKYIATYYHKPSVIFVPSIILEDIQKGLIKDDFNYKKEYPYYVKKQSGNVSQVTYKLRPIEKDDIPFLFRNVSRFMKKYTLTEVQAFSYGVVVINGISYLFVDRNANIDGRIKQIDVQ